MNRHVITAGHAPAACAVSSVVVVTVSYSESKRSQVHAVSNVSLIMPNATIVVAVSAPARMRCASSRPRRTRTPSTRRCQPHRVVVDAGVVVEDALDRTSDPGVEGMIGGLERKQEQRVTAVVGAGQLRLERIEEATVGGIQTGLGDRTAPLRYRRKMSKNGRSPTRVRRPVLQSHPRFGDHTERAFGAQQHAVRRRPRTRAGQPTTFPHAARGDRSNRLDEVIDMGVQRRVVPTRARREPAAKRRELERLWEVSQRQPVRTELILERRAVDTSLNASGAGFGVDLDDLVESPHVDTDRAGVVVVDVALDTADHR